MDLIDLIKEKVFFGTEFLTWLWRHSVKNSGLIEIPGLGHVELWFEKKMVLALAAGEETETITCQGQDPGFKEAKTAIRDGKKISQARLRLHYESREVTFGLKAEGLEITGLALPREIDLAEEEEDGLAGRLLDRIARAAEITAILDGLFAMFLERRLTNAWVETEQPDIRRWLAG